MDKLDRQKGFSIIEILIAMALAIIVISGTAAASGGFGTALGGHQSTISDGELNTEALHKAQDLIEQASADARVSYASVAASTATECSGGLCYQKELTVPLAYTTQCSKAVSSMVSWGGTYSRSLWVGATTTIVNIPEMLARGGDCDFTPPSGWDNPDSAVSINLGGQGATDIDVDDSTVYITSDPSPVGTHDFFAYAFDPVALTLVQSDSINLGGGINRVDVGGGFAYLANASSTSSASNEELLVIDVSDPTDLQLVGKATLGITPSCPTFCPGGARSVEYYDGRVYIGTHRISGHEFYIYDVSTPSSPSLVRSVEIDHNVNDIVVSGDYAYLATSNDTGEIMIYDIADPGPITLVGSYNANKTGSDTEDAQRLFLVGDRLYFGRDDVNNASERDFYILDVSDPTTPTEIGSYALTLNPNTYVAGVSVKGSLAFVAADDPNEGLQILDISNPASIVQNSPCSPVNFSENSSAMDVDGNFIFVSSISNDEIRVFQDMAGICTP